MAKFGTKNIWIKRHYDKYARYVSILELVLICFIIICLYAFVQE